MKNNHFFVYTVVIILSALLSSCLKKDGQRYTISGHFYENCSRQPIANKALTFYQTGGGGGTVGTATTDANGAFKLSYTPLNGSNIRAGIPLNVGIAEYGEIGIGDYSNVNFIAEPTCYLKVSMQVFNNSYTNRDTLYIGDAGSNDGAPTTLKIQGPFVSKLIYAVPNYRILNYIYDNTYIPVIFRINSKEFNQGQVKITSCDTLNYVAEIR